jgi:beta-galactosidase
VVAGTTEAGSVVVEVTSPGLKPTRLELTALAALPGFSAVEGNEGPPGLAEVPVRKIELVAAGGTRFDPTRRTLTVEARLHPANASYRDVEWRVTNDAGVDSNLAEVVAAGPVATLSARGDGPFRLRCSTRNGGAKTVLYSQLEFSASGLGTAFLDPYALVSGGLFTRSRGELGNGNDRGVATPRDGESQVCFDGVDFGPWGSDEITLPLFSLDGAEFAIEVWEGLPSDPGSERLATVTYQKPSIWNTYQPETYRLQRRLRGVTSICFVFHRKVHLKGFWFTRQTRAFETIWAFENDAISGDSYQITGDAVEAIGNNVSLEFRDLDFGAAGCRAVTICGRSSLDRNTIHLRFASLAGETTQLAEFPGAAAYEQHTFVLEPVMGVNRVTLVFLPGSQFDLKWLKFS